MTSRKRSRDPSPEGEPIGRTSGSTVDGPAEREASSLLPSPSRSVGTEADSRCVNVTPPLLSVTLQNSGATAGGESSTSATMPMVGLGTFRCKGNTCKEAVAHALRLGVRLIDTAEGYKNEAEVAAGIESSGVPRGKLFLITKVSKDSMGNASKVHAAVTSSLKNLKTTYLDMVLLHWPGTKNTNAKSPLHAKARIEAWKVLQEFVREKVVRHIGVSNFTVEHLKQLSQADGVVMTPSLNQVECHPWAPQAELRSYCQQHGICVQAYTSLGRCREPPKVLYGIREPDHPRLVSDVRVQSLAKEMTLTEPQLLLRWALQRGLAVIPKSSSKEHIEENFKGLTGTVPAGVPSSKRETDTKTRSGTGQTPAAAEGRWLSERQLGRLDSLARPQGYEDTEVRYAYPLHKVPQ